MKMKIENENKLTRFTKEKAIESDHSPLVLYLGITIPDKNRKKRSIGSKEQRQSTNFQRSYNLYQQFIQMFSDRENFLRASKPLA